MISLDKDLQKSKKSLDDFGNITRRILSYLPNILSDYQEKSGYRISSSEIAGTKKYIRPVKKSLFIDDESKFQNNFRELKSIFQRIKTGKPISASEHDLINSTVYTIQQSVGAGLDLLVNPNSARKHVGNRFEELIKIIFTEIGVANKRLVLQIPYEAGDGIKTYKCENDLILSPYKEVKSDSSSIDSNEIVVSIKTTSKDRMGKMFIDKILLERFVDHPQKVIGIFLNDVQRKESNNISYTLVSGLFMVYTKFLTQLDGIYYLDPPPNANKKPYSDYMKPFSELITNDINSLLST